MSTKPTKNQKPASNQQPTKQQFRGGPKDDDPSDIDCDQPITCPFTVIIDTREQSPYSFRAFKADSRHKSHTGIAKDLYIPTEVSTLKTGDYSIKGFESEIAIERKSLTDLFGTLGSGRDRFERELKRLSEFKVAHVVIEADWKTILYSPPDRTKLSPKSIFRSINAWEQEFPNIHWQPMGMRSIAEHKTFRILERFWNQQQKAAQSTQGSIAKENPPSGVTNM